MGPSYLLKERGLNEIIGKSTEKTKEDRGEGIGLDKSYRQST